ncbi:MAG: hypothetical protein HYX75_00045 [Acidobacteria bacterium]|nr:hypothetical protein [Acidobacteriota bacterium]
MLKSFDEELGFFIEHQEELVSQYRGKILVLVGPKVVGVHNTVLDAYLEAQKEYELGTFMIQPCEPGPDAYTVTITSHVATF